VVAACLFAGATNAAAGTLTAGYYATYNFVVSASVSGSGTCLDGVGTAYDTEDYYPGPAKTGAKTRRQFNAKGVLEIQITTLPETPAAGATTWSGSYSSVFEPGGTKAPGTFSSTFTNTDGFSNIATTTLVYKVEGGGTCTTTIQQSRFYSG
jgi:hypothetical protein